MFFSLLNNYLISFDVVSNISKRPKRRIFNLVFTKPCFTYSLSRAVMIPTEHYNVNSSYNLLIVQNCMYCLKGVSSYTALLLLFFIISVLSKLSIEFNCYLPWKIQSILVRFFRTSF